MSSTGLRGMGVSSYLDAWRSVEHFIASCAGGATPKLLRCDLQKLPQLPASRDIQLRQLEEILGSPVAGYSPGQTEYNWIVAPAELERALDYADLIRAHSSSKEMAARLTFRFSHDFLLCDPDTQSLLPCQAPSNYGNFEAEFDHLLGLSYLRTSLRTGYSLGVFLTFPFEEPNESFTRFVRIVEDHFPTRLSPKHWKHWHLNKRGASYVGRKLQLPAGVLGSHCK